jgi:hypothetical protein
MVKSGTQRGTKYGNKVDASVVSARITALKDDMQANAAAAQEAIAQVQAQVRVILDDTPAMSTTLSQPFMAAGLEMWKKSQMFTGQNKINEVTYVYTKWNTRLTVVTGASVKLKAIAALFGVTIA